MHQWNAGVGVWNLRGTGEPSQVLVGRMGRMGKCMEEMCCKVSWMDEIGLSTAEHFVFFLNAFGSVDAEHRSATF